MIYIFPKLFSMIKWRHLSICLEHCPLCMSRRIIVRLDENELAVRCLWCRSSAVTMSLAAVLSAAAGDLESKEVYELSSRGPLFKHLKQRAGKLTFSEYFDQVGPGEFHNGVQCQDVQNLTYSDKSFDICTSTEVFEHVPDDLKGFSEIFRVLRPGGLFIFTVPLSGSVETVERARLKPNGRIEHLLPPEYHIDPARDHKGTLVFRNYGADIVQRLKNQGFSEAKLVNPEINIPWGLARRVVVCTK